MPKPVKIGFGRQLSRASALGPVSGFAVLGGIVLGVFWFLRKK